VLACSAVSSGDEIVRQAQVFEPDVILYNLGTSDLESLNTIATLRRMFPNLSIVVFAPPEHEHHRQETLEAGANDFITRHTVSLSLLPAIWKLVALYQRRYSANLSKKVSDAALIPPPPKGLDHTCLTQ
jgi:DNA-binding NarL/FixJ family response regulator